VDSRQQPRFRRDDAMLQVMIAENAGQQHENMASVLDAVAAVMCKITHEALVSGTLPKSGSVLPGPFATFIKNGVGRPQILAYFETHVRGQIVKDNVESAVATLKASTQYAALMQGPFSFIRLRRTVPPTAPLPSQESPRKSKKGGYGNAPGPTAGLPRAKDYRRRI
jgi:hypothetical protein